MEEEYSSKDLSDYIDAFRRRKVSIAVVSLTIFLIALVVALVWPPTYRSAATILIEEQEIPSDLVRSTITSFANQRIQTIKARVMTRKNLMEIIEKYNLYEKDRRYKTTEEVLENMRDDIAVNTLNAEVIDPVSGRPGEATIAFTLAYDGDSPGATQKVANELTTLYLSENLRERTEKSEEALSFLTAETNKLSKKISAYESKLAEFKEKNADLMPDMQVNNLRVIERGEDQLVEISSKLDSLEERKFYLENQLAQTDPIGSITTESGYRNLEPVVRLKYLERNLEQLRSEYTLEHPTFIAKKREIEDLKKLIAEKREEGETGEVTEIIPQNPTYIAIQSQLATTNAEIKSLRTQQDEMNKKLIEYEQRMAKAPMVEKEYRLLLRDYNSATDRYSELQAKQMSAEIGQELEKERKGERFSLIEPAQFPEKPISPNRPAIIFLGFILSLAGGFGSAIILESLSSAVRGTKQIIATVGAAPLSVIPHMMNEYDFERTIQVRKISIVVAVTGFVFLVLMVHFAFSPLDVLWFRGMRKVDSVLGL
ncbi:MAG: GumC family protein [Gammaproteobacteria bacterium]|nr:GumC family protein [Gammaproteobacteria bacterium]